MSPYFSCCRNPTSSEWPTRPPELAPGLLWTMRLVHHFAAAEGISCPKRFLLSDPQPAMFLPDMGNSLCSLSSVVCSMRSPLTLCFKSEASSSPPCSAPIFRCFTFPRGIRHCPGYSLSFVRYVSCLRPAVEVQSLQDKIFVFWVLGVCISASGRWQLLFSCSVVSSSLRSHGLQRTRLPCPSLSLRVCSNSLSKWVPPVNGAIQPFHPLLPPSPPAINLSQHQGLFQWVMQ